MSLALELTIFHKLFAAVAEAAVFYVFLTLLTEDYPINQGCFRPGSGGAGRYPGGQPGAPGENVLITPAGEKPLPGKTNLTLPAGSRLSIRTPGGGGWGAVQGADEFGGGGQGQTASYNPSPKPPPPTLYG